MDKIHQNPCAVCIGFFLLSIPIIAGVLKLNHQCVFVCVCGLGVSNGVAEGQVAPLLGRPFQDRKISLIWTDKVKKPLRIEAMNISTEDGDWGMP